MKVYSSPPNEIEPSIALIGSNDSNLNSKFLILRNSNATSSSSSSSSNQNNIKISLKVLQRDYVNGNHIIIHSWIMDYLQYKDGDEISYDIINTIAGNIQGCIIMNHINTIDLNHWDDNNDNNIINMNTNFGI